MAKAPRPANLARADEDAMMTAIGEEPSAPPNAEDEGPSYKVVGESKIPVSKARGKLWESRKNFGVKNLKDTYEAWDEAICYYHATQDLHRSTNGTPDVSSSATVRQRKNRILSEQENLVFANTAALVPSLYAKSPEITTTGNNDELKDLYECVEELGNVIIARRAYPGINLTPKVRKAIISASLANEGWIETGWTFKDESSEKALNDLKLLSDQFKDAKDDKELKEIEGKLMALEMTMDVLTPSGPWAKYRQPKQVLVDDNAENDDGTDANWMMVWDMFPTQALNAMYGEKDKNGNIVSIYKPTHRMETNEKDGSSIDNQVKNFTLFTSKDEDDPERNKQLDVTKVWYVYDKVTRRIELYHDKNWKWPIWVWEDRLHLDTFFPLEPLKFHTSPTKTRMKGEVSYYLDQVDSINEINDAEARGRDMVKNNGFFDKALGLTDKDLQEVLNGPDGTMKGVTVPEGKKLDDLFVNVTPEFLKYPTLFDDNAKNRKLQAIDRIASVGEVQRGGQFKTNTTNKAIDTYNSTQNTRLDDRVDAIETFIGNITWKILQLCLQFMEQPQVAVLVGQQRAAHWKQMDPDAIAMAFSSCRVDGGSTAKPTSKAKKAEALELMQVLGQFVNAAPNAVIKILFRVGERAFDEWVMNDNDWVDVNAELQFRQTQEATSNGIGGEQSGEQSAIPPELQQAMQQLPPEAQKAIMSAIQKGVPPDQAIQQVTQLIQQQPEGGA